LDEVCAGHNSIPAKKVASDTIEGSKRIIIARNVQQLALDAVKKQHTNLLGIEVFICEKA